MKSAKIISLLTDQDANIIFGAVIKEDLSDSIRITVIATGFDETRSRIAQMRPSNMRQVITGVVSEPVQSQPSDIDEEEVKDDNGDNDTFGDKFEIPAFLRKIH